MHVGVGLCVKYKIQIQEYNNKCNSEGTVHVGMSMCMYIVQIQIHKYNDKYKSAGTVHVRRCAHHMASPPFALHKMKKTFDSFEVSENILQKDSSPHAREGRVELFWRRSSFLLRVLAIYYGHLELAANRPKCT